MFYAEKYEINYTDTDKFRIMGRTHSDDGGLHLSWPASGIEFYASCDRITLYFNEYTDEAVFKVIVGNSEAKYVITGKSPKILLENLGRGKKKISVIKVSENYEPIRFLKAELIGKEPKVILPKPEGGKLKMEFLGDSITAGYGVLSSTDDITKGYEFDGTKTYAYMTAKKLCADARMVCISGEGICFNCAKEPGVQQKNIFNLRTRKLGSFDHSEFQPDIMVINCGTNDVPGETPYEDMEKGCRELIEIVRGAYPNAEIVWFYGMMRKKYADTIKKVIDEKSITDKKLHFLFTKEIYGYKNNVGGVGHPNVNASVRASKELTKYIKENILNK